MGKCEAYQVTSSTRRFLALPSSEVLEATGAYNPQPNESRRFAAIGYFDLNSLTRMMTRAAHPVCFYGSAAPQRTNRSSGISVWAEDVILEQIVLKVRCGLFYPC